MDRCWDATGGNSAATRCFDWLLGRAAAGPANVIRLMFSPAGLRPHVANWEEAAEALIQRVHREAVAGVVDPPPSHCAMPAGRDAPGDPDRELLPGGRRHRRPRMVS